MIGILDNIRSGENVGSIIRTAEALGVDEIWLLGITPGPDQKSVKKASLGAEKHLRITEVKNYDELFKKIHKENLFLIALETGKKSVNIDNFKKPIKDFALVLGNEVSGVDERILNASDEIVSIPMKGKKESLNVSVSFGIATYLLKFFDRADNE